MRWVKGSLQLEWRGIVLRPSEAFMFRLCGSSHPVHDCVKPEHRILKGSLEARSTLGAEEMVW